MDTYLTILNDSLTLKNLSQNNPDDNAETILSTLSNFIDIENILMFYQSNFEQLQLIKLLEDFRFLENKSVNDVLIIMKWNDFNDKSTFFKNAITPYLQQNYQDIVLQKSLFLTLVYNNSIYPLNYFYDNNDLYEALEISILQHNSNSFRFLIEKEIKINRNIVFTMGSKDQLLSTRSEEHLCIEDIYNKINNLQDKLKNFKDEWNQF